MREAIPLCILYQLLITWNKRIAVLWNVKVYRVVEIYQHFRSVS